jgi:TorA maturation chaperone TorD
MNQPFVRDCRHLAGLLAAPGEESLEVVVHLAQTDAPWLREAAIQTAATPLQAWQWEHTRLFINGIPKTVCPPFASSWQEGHMWGQAAFTMQTFYARIGLMAMDGTPPDYLGTQLECAAFLAERSDAQSQTDFQELWCNHLAPWGMRFAERLTQEAQMILYQAVGHQLTQLFASDVTSLIAKPHAV